MATVWGVVGSGVDKQEMTVAGDIDELVECLPGLHRVPSLVPHRPGAVMEPAIPTRRRWIRYGQIQGHSPSYILSLIPASST